MRTVIRFLTPLALLLAFLAPAGTATAAPADSERFVAFVGSLNTCNGEIVQAEGTMHIVTKVQKDGTFLFRFNLHAQGVGDQGNEYVINWNRTDRSNQNSFSFTDRILVISKGSAPNFAFIFHSDSDGNFTFDEDCRG
jgi:hypothetical protein